jgi:hypothetical protein
MSLFDYLFGRHRVKSSTLKEKVASNVKNKIDNTIVYNPLNDWRVAALRQYFLYPLIKMLFGPIIVSSKGKHYYQRITVAIQTLESNSVRPFKRTMRYGIESLLKKKNPFPLMAWAWSLLFGDTLFVRMARFASGSSGVSAMKSVALSSLILERRRMLLFSWLSRIAWISSIAMYWPLYQTVTQDGLYRSWRSVYSSYMSGGFSGFYYTAVGEHLTWIVGLWFLSLVFSVLFSVSTIFSATRKVEEFLVWTMKLTDDEVEKLNLLATPYCLAAMMSSDKVTMQRIGTIRGNWPNKFSPGPGVLSPVVEGAFVMAARPQAEVPMFIQSDLSNPQERKRYQSIIIKPMRDRKASSGDELVFCGEVLAPEVWEFRKNFVELKNNPHLVAIGRTRSGKTKSLLSLIYTFAAAYPDTIWYFADGKDGADFENCAKYLSEYPVAKIRDHSNGGLIEFANLTMNVYREFKRRQKLFAEASVTCSTIYEYRERVGDLPQIIFVMDEFFKFVAEMDFKKNENSPDTLAGIFRTLMAQGASFGIHLFVATQRYQETDVPTSIRTNLTMKLTHAVELKDAAFNDIPKGASLDIGKFFLSAQGHFSEFSNVSIIKSALPYIGSDDGVAMRDAAKEKIIKKTWNNDLEFKISDSDDERATPLYMARTFASMMMELNRDDIRKTSTEIDINTIQFIVPENGKLIGISSVPRDHLTFEHLQRIKTDASRQQCDAVLLYILGMKPTELKGGKQIVMIRESNDFGGVKIVAQTIYDLRKDRKNVNHDEKDDVFTHRLVYEKVITKDEADESRTEAVEPTERVGSGEALDRYLLALHLFETPEDLKIPSVGLVIKARYLPFGSKAVFVVVPNKKRFESALAVAEGVVADAGGDNADTAVFLVGQDLPKNLKASKRIGILKHEVIGEASRKITVERDDVEKNRLITQFRYMLLTKVGLCKTDNEYGATKHLIGLGAVIQFDGRINMDTECVEDLRLTCQHSGESVHFSHPVPFGDYSLRYLGIPGGVRLFLRDGMVAPLGTHTQDIIGRAPFEDTPVAKKSSKFSIERAILSVKSITVDDEADRKLLERMRD